MANEINFRNLMRDEKQKVKPKKVFDHDTTRLQPLQRPSSLLRRPMATPWPDDWATLPTLDTVKHCLSSQTPKYVYYQPNVLTASQQVDLLAWLHKLPIAITPGQSASWNTMTYAKRRVAMFDSPLPGPLAVIASSLVTAGVFELTPNHVLVNEYLPGQGILPHTDGPLYLPKTSTISIGGTHVLLKLAKRLTADQIGIQENKVALEVMLEGTGSLVTFCDEAYTNYVHSIDDQVTEEQASDCCRNAKTGTIITRGYRISLTFRFKRQNVC